MGNRLQQVLELLNQAQDYLTAGQLAESLNCSEKTVRNDVARLRELMAEKHCGSIAAKSNKGYRLEATPEQYRQLMRTLCGDSGDASDPLRLDDQYSFLEVLLKTGTVKLAQMEYEMFTSKKNVSRSADLAQNWLKKRGLAMTRKRGRGAHLEGPVHIVRLALWDLFQEMHQLRPADSGEKLDISDFWPGVDFSGVRQCIQRLETRYHFCLSYDGYHRFEFLLAAMLADSHHSGLYTLPKQRPEKTAGWEYDAALFLLEQLQKVFDRDISANEVWYVWFALSSSEVLRFTAPQAEQRNLREKRALSELVNALVRVISEILQQDFSEDGILKTGLLNYLYTVQINAHFGITVPSIASPAAEYQKEQYPDIYVACWAAENLLEVELETYLTAVNINVIASHFAGAAERKQVGARIYIVCNYGVGSSRLLSEQLKREFPGINILDILTPRDTEQLRIPPVNYDFVISTVPLRMDVPCDVIRIGNHLRQEDITAIRKRLNQFSPGNGEESGMGRKRAGALAEPGLVFQIKRSISKEELLKMLCSELYRRGCVREGFEDSVFRREETSSTTLPGGVAIPHGFPKYVLQQRIAVAILKQPIAWDTAEKVDMVFLLALNMDNQNGERDQIIRFYKGLIALVDAPEELRRFRSLSTPDDIAGYINHELISDL